MCRRWTYDRLRYLSEIQIDLGSWDRHACCAREARQNAPMPHFIGQLGQRLRHLGAEALNQDVQSCRLRDLDQHIGAGGTALDMVCDWAPVSS